MGYQELRVKLGEFFSANPEEELSVYDAAIKFDCDAVKARDILRGMEKQESLKARWERMPGQANPCKIYSVK